MAEAHSEPVFGFRVSTPSLSLLPETECYSPSHDQWRPAMSDAGAASLVSPSALRAREPLAPKLPERPIVTLFPPLLSQMRKDFSFPTPKTHKKDCNASRAIRLPTRT